MEEGDYYEGLLDGDGDNDNNDAVKIGENDNEEAEKIGEIDNKEKTGDEAIKTDQEQIAEEKVVETEADGKLLENKETSEIKKDDEKMINYLETNKEENMETNKEEGKENEETNEEEKKENEENNQKEKIEIEKNSMDQEAGQSK